MTKLFGVQLITEITINGVSNKIGLRSDDIPDEDNFERAIIAYCCAIEYTIKKYLKDPHREIPTKISLPFDS